MPPTPDGADERAVLLEPESDGARVFSTRIPVDGATSADAFFDANTSPEEPARSLMSKQKVALLGTMYLSYVMAIFSSSSFEVSMPAALDDRSLALDQADFALALSAGQVATVIGKLFCGFVVDLRGASSAFYEALFLIGLVMFVGIGCVSLGLNRLALLSFVALKLAKSAIWPAMAKAAKAAFDSSIFGRVWGVLVTSSRFGAVCGGLALSPIVLLGWAWPGLVVGAGCVLIAIVLRVQTLHDRYRTSSAAAAAGEIASSPSIRGGAKEGTIGIREAARLYGRDPKLLLIAASEGMLLAVMDTSSLLPLYLHTQLGADLDEAARLASLFPLGMVIATFAGGFMYDALGPAMRASMLFGLGVCSAVSYALLATPFAEGEGDGAPLRAGMLLFVAGACFAPAKYLPPTIYTLENVDPQQ